MGFKPRTKRGPTEFVRSRSGETWSIGARDLTLVEDSKQTRFADYRSLVTAAAERIQEQEKRGFQLAGNVSARAAGVLNKVTPEQITRACKQFGPRRSLWTDAAAELSAVLSDPRGFYGGVLLIDGDLTIDGSWDAGAFAAVVILGNCSVKGLLYQYQTEPWFVVTGDLVVDNLIMAGNLDVGGDIRAEHCAEFESSDGYTHAGGEIEADTVFIWDMPVTCSTLCARRSVSSVDLGKYRLVCPSADLGQQITKLRGPELRQTFHPCVLSDRGATPKAAAADPELPELDTEQLRIVHWLGLPVTTNPA